MTESVVARFKQEQALQEQAAQQGLYGVAIVASHEIITARMERGAERLLQLMEEGRHEEAKALFSTEEPLTKELYLAYPIIRKIGCSLVISKQVNASIAHDKERVLS